MPGTEVLDIIKGDTSECLVPEVSPRTGQRLNYPDDVGKFLQTYHWDYFLTITPKSTRVDPLAFMRDVWEDIKPHPGWEPDSHVTRAFLACEPFFLGHNLHVHGLIAGDSDIKLPWWFNEGFNFRFGRSRVELCRSEEQVSAYCSKYVSKFLGGDNYDFFGDWT